MTARLRLWAGLVLFVYVTTHLLNHSLGLISLGAAEAGRVVFTAVWRNPLAGALLYASLLTHVALALWAIYARRSLSMPRWEIVRVVTGILIPLPLIMHVFSTRVQQAFFGYADTYTNLVYYYWVIDPQLAVQQIAFLLVAWIHGWIGVYYWARAVPGGMRWARPLRAVAVLVPLLAVIGFIDMGREVAALAADPLRRAEIEQANQAHGDALAAEIAVFAIVFGSIALAFAARPVRAALARRRGVIRLTYPDGRRVAVVPGTSVLEASRVGGIPHASLCGGRGRCSTCRSRMGSGLVALPPPAPNEERVLKRVNAPPDVRLACQVRPRADLDVFPLLPPVADLPSDLTRSGYAGGVEREVAILFADIRGFTPLAEKRLPYDVVFILNQYSTAMGRAIEGADGLVNQFIGDGIMALFGVTSGAVAGCQAALRAALAMSRALETLNETLSHDLAEPLRIGIGIHAGSVILGEMGYGRARYFTAIGDPVNTASRIEGLTKEYACQLIVSEAVANRARVDLTAFPAHELQVRGRSSLLTIHTIPSALALEPLLPATSNGASVLPSPR